MITEATSSPPRAPTSRRPGLALVGGAMVFALLAPWLDILGVRRAGWQFAFDGGDVFWRCAAWASLIGGTVLIVTGLVLPRLARVSSQLVGAVTSGLAASAIGRVAFYDFRAGAWLMLAGSIGLVAWLAIPRVRAVGLLAGVVMTGGCFVRFGSGMLGLGTAGSLSWARYMWSGGHVVLLGILCIAIGPLGVASAARPRAGLRWLAALGGLAMALTLLYGCAIAVKAVTGWGAYVALGAGSVALVASLLRPRRGTRPRSVPNGHVPVRLP